MKRETKMKNMTAPRYGGGEGLLYIKCRAEPEVVISEKVQSEHDYELSHVRRVGR